ncbi:rhomboid domain-containing protein 3 [Python bivittatus]|uniref:Rhomboid domain-containing protein 3 n=1 Tax=Python bivittatus TaxID=176946 RepID=A0A9F2RAB0_PYTBI|nr:rhomboid domain-containing protein 3 [Python bivittatus]XP_025030847.1 rhomboid domain-containing protein 3 [Python bivittatus]
MLIQRLRWVRHPPLASSILMLLLGLFWVTGVEESFILSPGLLTSPFQAFRLVTYCLCHANAPLLATSLLFFPLLGWHRELQQGTLGYLQAAGLGAALSALLYLLLAGLWGAEPHAAVSGYIPVHLALLGCHGRRSGWFSVALLAGLLFGLGEILSPRSPFLLHLSGLLTGLAYCAGTSFSLGLSKRCLERLWDGIPRWSHIRCFLPHFVRPLASSTLPTTARKERIPAQEMFPPNLAGMVAIQVPPSPSWTDGSAAQESQLLFPSTSLQPFSALPGASDMPFFAFPTEEELIQAGIQASLQDIGEEEVKLPKSSVSSLRLQQLQRMGFPTEESVIALAATGHVEGAVSLLIGGHVGGRAVVTAENRSVPHTQPQSSPDQ